MGTNLVAIHKLWNTLIEGILFLGIPKETRDFCCNPIQLVIKWFLFDKEEVYL